MRFHLTTLIMHTHRHVYMYSEINCIYKEKIGAAIPPVNTGTLCVIQILQIAEPS